MVNAIDAALDRFLIRNGTIQTLDSLKPLTEKALQSLDNLLKSKIQWDQLRQWDRSSAATKTFSSLEKASVQLASVLIESEKQSTLLQDSNSTSLKVTIGKVTPDLNLPNVNLHISQNDKEKDPNETLRYVYWTLEPKIAQHLFPNIRWKTKNNMLILSILT